METKVYVPNPDELKVLQFFYKIISDMGEPDNTISGSKILKATQRQFEILRDDEFRCTCNRRRYDMCEVCQASGDELYNLRIFFRVMCKAKQNNMNTSEIKTLIENIRERLVPKTKKRSRS